MRGKVLNLAMTVVVTFIRSTLSSPLQKTTPGNLNLNAAIQGPEQHESEHMTTWLILLLVAVVVVAAVVTGFCNFRNSYRASKKMTKYARDNYTMVDNRTDKGTPV